MLTFTKPKPQPRQRSRPMGSTKFILPVLLKSYANSKPMSLLIKPESSSCRFYTVSGEPRYDATIREARKEGLLPSVSQIVSLWPKYALDAWRIEQGIMAALTLPRLSNEPLDAFARRVVADGQAQVKDTADWGTEFHRCCEHLHRTYSPPKHYPVHLVPHVERYRDWFRKTVQTVLGCENNVTNTEVGYAGRLDLHADLINGSTALGDIKSRSVKNGKPVYYETQIIQLVAYGKCLPAEPDMYFSVIVNRDNAEPPCVKYWSTEEAKEAWQDFLSLHALWCRVNSYKPYEVNADAVKLCQKQG